MHAIQRLLEQLIQCPSVTPEDAGTQGIMIDYLGQLGFECTVLNQPPVSNFFAIKHGQQGSLLMFAGHTDVVAAGDVTCWSSDPFVLTSKQGRLQGRGVADMKGSLACMLHMAKRFIDTYPDHQGSLAFLITSGEEGDDYLAGTPYVMRQLIERGIRPDYCIVGEPSSTDKVGDVIKIGRRGSLSAKVKITGLQGHVAYPDLAQNPIHQVAPVLVELSRFSWDKGNDFFPPTSLQITHISTPSLGGNMIPGSLEFHFNLRFSTEQTAERLKQRIINCLNQYGLKCSIDWRLSGEPFLTDHGRLLQTVQAAIEQQTGTPPALSTTGGTSDGRFIAPYGVETIELGLCNATIHKANESVTLQDLEALEKLYFLICEKLLL